MKLGGGVDRIYVTRLVTSGGLFMNAVLNFWVPWNVGIFLSISFRYLVKSVGLFRWPVIFA